MSRRFLFAIAAAVALFVSLAVIRIGTSQVGVVSSAEAAAKSKTCKSRTPAGKVKTWRCGADQPCCVSHELGLYVCGMAGLGALGCI